jgi:predicted small secreted protein
MPARQLTGDCPAPSWRGAFAVLAFALAACTATTRGEAPDAPAGGHARTPDPARALLHEAIETAGGLDALGRVRALHWTGEATVFAGDRRIELGVDTRIEPFLRAKSDTWLRDQGRATLRTLEVLPDGGWMTRDDKREPMPADMLEHERLQYATYGLMLLAPLDDAKTVLRREPDRDGLRILHVEHPNAAPADLYFDANAALVRLEDTVPAAEGAGRVLQRFDFEGVTAANGIRWPRTIRITQDGKPYFELRIATLVVE